MFITESHPNKQRQRLTQCSFFIILFILLTLLVHATPLAAILNQWVAKLLPVIQKSPAETVLQVISLMGEKMIIIPTIVIVSLWLLYKHYIRLAVYWLITLIITSGSVWEIKRLTMIERPEIGAALKSNFAFPSGHTALVTLLFGLLAMTLLHQLTPGAKKGFYFIATILVGLVAFARLLLGLHWLTDVLGGILLGLGITYLVAYNYCRKEPPRIPTTQFIGVFFFVFLAVSGFFLFNHGL